MKRGLVPRDFPPAMVTAVDAALAAGLFYDTDIHRFVLEYMGGPGCTPVLLREVTLTLGDRSQEEAIWEELTRSPRGTYAILHYRRDDGYVSHRAPMSDGSGDLSGHACYDPFDPDDPTGPAHALDRLVGYEIYLCRKAVEVVRGTTRNLAAQAVHRFAVGQRLTCPLWFGATQYSSASITAIDPSTGEVTLELVRRGSPRRPRRTLGTADLASLLADSTPRPGSRR